MTQREAKRYVCNCAAASLENDIVNGAYWICEDNDISAADSERVEKAIRELADELRRRGDRR